MGQPSSNGRTTDDSEWGVAPLRLYDAETTKEGWATHDELLETATKKVCELHQQLERMRALRQSCRDAVARSRRLHQEARLARKASPALRRGMPVRLFTFVRSSDSTRGDADLLC
jgi:hypothetical protein